VSCVSSRWTQRICFALDVGGKQSTVNTGIPGRVWLVVMPRAAGRVIRNSEAAIPTLLAQRCLVELPASDGAGSRTAPAIWLH